MGQTWGRLLSYSGSCLLIWFKHLRIFYGDLRGGIANFVSEVKIREEGERQVLTERRSSRLLESRRLNGECWEKQPFSLSGN